MNATVVQLRVDKIINDNGNTLAYNNPLTGATFYNSEGDWTPTYATTTLNTKWIQAVEEFNNDNSQFGMFNLAQNEAIVKGGETFLKKGKCISNSIEWQVDDIKPVRVKDITVAQIISLKEILPKE